jgi:hypothetical protein
MGTAEDMKMRQSLARRDDSARRAKVLEAQNWIKQKKSLDSKSVKEALGGQGLVPADVSRASLPHLGFTEFHAVECLFAPVVRTQYWL